MNFETNRTISKREMSKMQKSAVLNVLAIVYAAIVIGIFVYVGAPILDWLFNFASSWWMK